MLCPYREITGQERLGQDYAPRKTSSGPVRQDSYPPARQDGYAPVRQDGYAPVRQDGYAPVRQDGYAPIRQDGYASIRQDPNAPEKPKRDPSSSNIHGRNIQEPSVRSVRGIGTIVGVVYCVVFCPG